jgi:3-hydroxyisobutyrate dehydrogenase/2-hydroxy-3-oxopropionate reductase
MTATVVGVVGLGVMGGRIAGRLLDSGYPVLGTNRTPERAVSLVERGLLWRDTPREVAAAADVVLSSVADDTALGAVASGSDGILGGLRPGTVYADMSTVSPQVSQGLALSVRRLGAEMLDAPVSGSAPQAEAGQLTIMVGGEEADLERARPVLDSLSARVFHMGTLGSGAVMKLAVNNVVMGINQSVSESLVLAERAGIDRSKAYDVFSASAIGAPFVQYKRAAFLDPEGTPMAFSVELAAKDMGLVLELGEQVGADLPQAEIDVAVLHEIADAGDGGRDLSWVASHLRSSPNRPDEVDPTRREGVPMA